ncbi:MAG: M23 family metallopeptidase [Stagnimonas sp.]|nr:M23 family metallopeptidase [Stagnimonas sp.]
MKRGVFQWLAAGSVSLAGVLAFALPIPGIAPPAADGAALLAQRPLVIPVAGVRSEQLVDTFEQGRPGHRHEAIDILAPRGTPVHAVDDGKVAKLFTSVPGGLTIYHFDPAGRLAYYYAHLDRYAPGLKEGMPLRRGDVIGYVGTTGNASPDAPHLHFAVFRLGPLKQWWKGDAINPYPALRQAASSVAAK